MIKATVMILSLLMFCAPLSRSAEIHQAVEAGDLAEVKRLLNESPELIEDRDDHQTTPLLVAAINGNEEMVRYLLEKGADLTAINDRGSNVLHLAADKGHADLAEYFIERGVDLNSVSHGGFTPLLYSIYQGHSETVELLISKGADMSISDNQWGGSAIHWACIGNNPEVLDLLLARGADLNSRSVTDSSTPIFWAANAGNNEALEFLIKHGVRVQAATLDGWTPLHNAARNGHLETARILLENGASLEASNLYGTTPFMAAADNGHESLAQLMLEYGVDINQPDSNGLTALHYAAMQGNTDMANFLVLKGADVNAVDDYEDTPLIRAIYGGQMELTSLLLDNGADPNVVDEDGRTALWESVIQGHDSITAVLLDHKANLDLRDNRYNRTELHYAAIKGNETAVRLLLKHGADINAVDNAGHTPLYYAGKYGHESICKLLIDNGGTAEQLERNFGNSKFLKQEYGLGEAVVWYLGHCGYAVKTRNHLLIFDYWNNGRDPADPRLANGHINLSEISDQNVLVFVTHEHRDHYDTSIFRWKGNIENITYVYGFRPEDLPENRETGYTGPEYDYFGPREKRIMGKANISTIKANDAGVGFLVEVDGLKIYHAGDHAGWREGEKDEFLVEIDYLAGLVSDVDFAFLNVTGCHAGDTTALAEGTLYTLNKLNPKVWFPTHGLNREYIYKTFAEKMVNEGVTSEAACPENRGDKFIFRNGRVQ